MNSNVLKINYVYDNETEPEQFVCMSNDYGLIAIRLQSSIRKCFTGKSHSFHDIEELYTIEKKNVRNIRFQNSYKN
jgi:hypothetical protein